MAASSSSPSLLLRLVTVLSTAHFLCQLVAQAASGGGAGAEELWCVAKNNAETAALQRALDWACGAGGADCRAIQQGGACYDPADMFKTASYAFNDYFLKNDLTDDSCNFAGTAALTSLNPSEGSCKFPSSSTVKNGSFAGMQTTVGIGPASADTSAGNHGSSGGTRRRWAAAIAIQLFYAITVACRAV
ncbi:PLASMODESMATA CALLOSE-BINDING PROTEIN 5-like [Diospyros lotus]|uniref:PLASMODESMATA CALLOSE-BINDING PROTEIN 5-like n=1 Tax=Diospyros lotus TaxID=55363 RepID=UPI002253EB7E|nr:PLASMODESMATA CALLOSE-BINDING PROTEIN 5-like [Diospyros lotus]